MSLYLDYVDEELAVLIAESTVLTPPVVVDGDYGTDIWCIDDIDEGFTEISGRKVLIQNLIRRLRTPRGGIIDAPDYGLDLAELLSRGMTPAEVGAIPGAVRSELLKDERVAAVAVTSRQTGAEVLELTIKITPVEGEPFQFTVDASAAGVLLKEAA